MARPAGDTSRLQELYRAEFPALVRYATRLLGDVHLAHELTQEAFTKLIASGQHADDPAAYVFVVLTNLIRTHWRSRDRERGALRTVHLLRRETEPGPRREVADAVERLPARLREPVLLFYFADLSVEEVARALGRPLGTVKRQLHQARVALHGALREVPDET